MAPDERDRSFDKALARHLRSATTAGEAAGMPAIPASHGGACPDSEMLAAYHERSLLSEQMNSLKEHLVGCANCQSILAQLEATEEISLQAANLEEVLVAKESEPLVAAHNVESFPAAPPAKKSRRVLLLRGARWQWLAPAGALAAGLLVWIAFHENRPLPLPSLNQVQVATNQAPTPPAPSVSRAVQEPPPYRKPALTKPQSATGAFSGANSRGALDATKSSEKRQYVVRALPSQPLADKESRLRKDAERRSSADMSHAEEQLERDAKTVSGARQENAEVQVQSQTVNVQSQNQSNANSSAVAGPAPLGQTEAKKLKAAPSAPAPPAVVGGVAGYSSAASMQVVSVSDPHLVAPPDSRVLWRAGRSGLIEFSKDGGSSWSRQTSGVLADLLTGAAPSDQVCWIVGRVGAILLTTDGGAHWKLISSPLSEDLGGIHATDALHASIWNTTNNKSFETSDGGLTWKRLAND